jgi:hypothetical protein
MCRGCEICGLWLGDGKGDGVYDVMVLMFLRLFTIFGCWVLWVEAGLIPVIYLSVFVMFNVFVSAYSCLCSCLVE